MSAYGWVMALFFVVMAVIFLEDNAYGKPPKQRCTQEKCGNVVAWECLVDSHHPCFIAKGSHPK